MTPPTLVAPERLERALARVEGAPVGLLALGIPRCPACRLLPATLAELRRARPGLEVALSFFESPVDWALRERLLWPRGIRASRSSVPSLTLLVEGRPVARRDGSAPAHLLDAWLAERLGPAERPPEPGPSGAEEALLCELAPRRAQREGIRPGGGEDLRPTL